MKLNPEGKTIMHSCVLLWEKNHLSQLKQIGTSDVLAATKIPSKIETLNAYWVDRRLCVCVCVEGVFTLRKNTGCISEVVEL